MEKLKEFGKDLQEHLMTGVSYMVPFVAAAGLMLALSSIIGKFTVGTAAVWKEEYANTFAHTVNKIGGMGFELLVPIIAGYIAYSIADKPGIAPGMICGVLASNMKAGFLGGIVVGLMSGYLVKWMKENIKLPPSIMPLLTIILIPLGATLTVALIFYYLIGQPIAGMMQFLETWLKGMQGSSKILLGAILGAMMAFDMGGPLNKTAVAFAFGMYASKIYFPNTAIHIAVSVPPLGMWLATKMAPDKYRDKEKTAADPAAVMAIFGITEGTIPIAMADPFRVIPSIMIGTATATGLAGFFNIINPVTLAFFLSWPFVNKPILYGVCMLVGMVVTALVANTLKPDLEFEEDEQGQVQSQAA